ncbi:MAG: CAP domain-containing protein [Chloroflexota bacterium]|nr:CAP domain-containing protein [Chloroflexota bacterium]
MKGILGILGFVLAVGVLAGVVAPAPASADSQEQAFLGLINDYRARNGLGGLSLNGRLDAAADYHSRDMADHGYLGHTLSDGTSAGRNIADHGYDGRAWGENVAAGYADADAVFVAWRRSPEHDRNMLGRGFDEIGIGRARAAGGTWYWTTTFGGSGGSGDDRARRVTAAPQLELPVDPTAADPDADGAAGDGPIVDGDPSPVHAAQDQVSGDVTAGGAPGEEAIPAAPVDPVVTGPVTADAVVVPSMPEAAPDPGTAATDGDVAPTVTGPEGGDALANGPATVAADPVGPPAEDGSAGTGELVPTNDGSNPEASGPAGVAAPATACADWYSAQIAYENAGGLNADPALVASLDPDYDGIACEEAMTP